MKKKKKKSWVYERKVFRFKIESVTGQTTVRAPWCEAGEEQGDNLILGGGSLDQLNRENIGNV